MVTPSLHWCGCAAGSVALCVLVVGPSGLATYALSFDDNKVAAVVTWTPADQLLLN